MKGIIIFITNCLFVLSGTCNAQEIKNVLIKGYIHGAENGSIVSILEEKNDKFEQIGSSIIKDERFMFENLQLALPGEYYIYFQKNKITASASYYATLYLDNVATEIESSIKNYPEILVKGSNFHEQYKRYQDQLTVLKFEIKNVHKQKLQIKYGDFEKASAIEYQIRQLREKMRSVSLEYIKNHPNWLYSAILITKTFNNYFDLKKEYEKLDNYVKNSKYGLALKQLIKNRMIKEKVQEEKVTLELPDTKLTTDDTLRGSFTNERSWWNVVRYDLRIKPDYMSKTISGQNDITFNYTIGGNRTMQIDLQEPLVINKIFMNGKELKFYKREGSKSVWYVVIENLMTLANNSNEKKISIRYSGVPHIAQNPPWDGGWIWAIDKQGRPWISVCCQDIGASIWYPCKDHQSDEPEKGASMTYIISDTLVAVSNGKLTRQINNGDGTTSWTWEIKNSINNYCITAYIGKYINWNESFKGERGVLDCNYWILDYNLEKSKKQFKQTALALKCFENWFGPYPFYEDGFKLCDAPYTGMEHQSGIAYGSHFINGYPSFGNSSDLSSTGWGLTWDYILVHETGHEWFGNSITTNDIADMWIHEGFTSYSEALFIESVYGKDAADSYSQGIRKNIINDKPVIGIYNGNKKGSSDMYNKGATIIHMIRKILDDDNYFRRLLRELNDSFYHKMVDTKDIEDFISRKSGKDFSALFNQYLRTTKVPVLEYKLAKKIISYRWVNCVDGFSMPVRLINSSYRWLNPTIEWQQARIKIKGKKELQVDQNFYVQIRRVE